MTLVIRTTREGGQFGVANEAKIAFNEVSRQLISVRSKQTWVKVENPTVLGVLQFWDQESR